MLTMTVQRFHELNSGHLRGITRGASRIQMTTKVCRILDQTLDQKDH